MRRRDKNFTFFFQILIFFAHSSIEIFCPFRLRLRCSPTMSSSRPDTAATNRDVDSEENRYEFIWAEEATTYDNLLLDGSISNADVSVAGWSGLYWITQIGRWNKDIDTDILISYLLTCDPPADVNGRSSDSGCTPMWDAAIYNNTSAVKVLIDFGGDRTIKTNSNASNPNMTPLDIAKKDRYIGDIEIKQDTSQEIIKLLTECFPSEE